MTDSKLLLTPSTRGGLASGLAAPEWRVLGIIGAVFLVVGGLDAVLAWVPADFGNAEWEFGTVSASLNGLPVPTLGLALILARSLALGDRTTARAVLAVYATMAILIVAAGLVYALDLALAFRAVTHPVAREGLKKAVVKTTTQLTVYPVAYLWLAIRYWKRTGDSA